MEENQKKGMPVATKVFIAINTLLFGITGIVYLNSGSKIIGYILLAAGVLNVLYLLITVKTRNLFFVVLNFLFAAVSLIVSIDYLTHENVNFGIVWMVITLVYLVIAFVLLLQVNKKNRTKREDL